MTTADDDAEVVEIDEVLPAGAPAPEPNAPPKTAKEAVKRVFPRVIARLLDECITLPNSNFRIGLDPIVGFFFPFVGDATMATLGSAILVEGMRRQIPRAVLFRMGGNILLNAAVGAVPVLGDAFSVWYKSNLRNYTLLEKHSGNLDLPRVRSSMWPVLLFLLGVFGVIALILLGLWALFQMAF